MYSWGGSTSDWRGSVKSSYNFGEARARYDREAKRSGATTRARNYTRKKEPDLRLVNPKNKEIISQSRNPIIIGIDVTGSMQTWPGEIFDRLPLLYQTLAKYREDSEFCFCAIGDASCDNYALQVNNFNKEINDLEAAVKALGAEGGGGGGQIMESYELFGYYMLNHCQTPNANSPFLLIYGDEKFYENVDARQVRHYIGDNLENALNSSELWKELTEKYNLYFLQKAYGEGVYPKIDKEVKENWADAIGAQRIIEVPNEERAVDVGMGLIAKSWGEYEDFTLNLDARHDKVGVKEQVHRSLRHVKKT
jgi:hypothetical protein